MSLANPTVLLVEDDDLNRDMLFRRLTRQKFNVEVAVNGREGLNKAIETMPDIILMDMRMPEMDGLEATRAIKLLDSIKHIPVIALSGDVMQSDREKALLAGCTDYATKPVDLSQLLDKIAALL